jgi:hypothetical protein
MAARGLPRRFPAGTRYVIEGRRGKSGKLQIVSRQLILPNGQQIDLNVTSYDRPRAERLKRQRLASGNR